jgi:hypothetical protein
MRRPGPASPAVPWLARMPDFAWLAPESDRALGSHHPSRNTENAGVGRVLPRREQVAPRLASGWQCRPAGLIAKWFRDSLLETGGLGAAAAVAAPGRRGGPRCRRSRCRGAEVPRGIEVSRYRGVEVHRRAGRASLGCQRPTTFGGPEWCEPRTWEPSRKWFS